MMKNSVTSFPRVGATRALKFATEKYFNGVIDRSELQDVGFQLRQKHWQTQKSAGIDFIPSNDFSFYDHFLDTAVLFNIVPKRYKNLDLDPLDEYFAMARGYQGEKGDVKALTMRKWFNTNYHYMVPEIDDDTVVSLVGTKPFDEYLEARALGIETDPVIMGAFTLLKLIKYTGKKGIEDFVQDIALAYTDMLTQFNDFGVSWIRLDEPAFVLDLSENDKKIIKALYREILSKKHDLKVHVQTYFGDIRDCYCALLDLPFDGIGLDFVEGKKNMDLIIENGFPESKILFAGVVNGKNIWRNNYKNTMDCLEKLSRNGIDIVVGTSCSLLHVPYALASEELLSDECKKHFAFAHEKLVELAELKTIIDEGQPEQSILYIKNQALFKEERVPKNKDVWDAVSTLSQTDELRTPDFDTRRKIQKDVFKLPLLPTTTIGSFPQTAEVKSNRSKYKKGQISTEQYVQFNKEMIQKCIKMQEEVGLDVLVHGEFERNDMVEYFGERLNGYLFTQNGWVQSYGTRCVKPPVIWGDISRSEQITVKYSTYAQSLTKKNVKGMLTGPVTILNWSFPREDIALKDSAFQIALAIKEEVSDLEAHGIKMIQIDEAALREKLPLRQSDWHSDYLDWAVRAFRIVHSEVRPETQIHTHMCYSEFEDIISYIEAMDADVISFEAARSDLSIVSAIHQCGFKTEVGPGVYDIHSPRVPSVVEMKEALLKILKKIPEDKLWVNPDCGLKTRGNEETIHALENMVTAAQEIRSKWSQ